MDGMWRCVPYPDALSTGSLVMARRAWLRDTWMVERVRWGSLGRGSARRPLRLDTGHPAKKNRTPALWGGDGSAGMRANRGMDSDDEVGSDESSDYDSE